MSPSQRPHVVPTLFDGQPQLDPAHRAVADAASRASDAKRSLRYMVDMALEFGRVTGLDNLIDRIMAFPQYRPFNALLLVLQRPGATYVLPAHEWRERYRRLIKPQEQPLVMLQPGGPVMFLFDVSQTESGPDSRPLPPELLDPFAMPPVVGAEEALRWLVHNAKADGVRVSEASFGFSLAGCAVKAERGPAQEVQLSRRPLKTAHVAVQYEALLNRAHSPSQKAMTLAHELGHIYCGHLGPCRSELWPGVSFWGDRRDLVEDVAEYEADAVARLVVRRLDPSAELPERLSGSRGLALSVDAVDLELVLTVAGRVMEMAEGHSPRRGRASERRR